MTDQRDTSVMTNKELFREVAANGFEILEGATAAGRCRVSGVVSAPY